MVKTGWPHTRTHPPPSMLCITGQGDQWTPGGTHDGNECDGTR